MIDKLVAIYSTKTAQLSYDSLENKSIVLMNEVSKIRNWFNENRNDFEPSVYTISRLKDIFNNVISYTDDVINIEQFNPNIDQIKAFLNDALSTIADVYNEVVARHKSQEKELSHNRVKRFREKRRQEMQASPTYKVKY